MQFPQQLITELTAPNTVPFLPGNNVTGFGASVPAELAAAGYLNAIVFYSSDWSTAFTTPTVKFRFIAADPNTTPGRLVFGYGIVNNPSVSQVATVRLGFALQVTNSVSANTDEPDFRIFNRNGDTVVRLSTDALQTDNCQFQLIRASDSTSVVQFAYNSSNGTGVYQLGTWTMTCSPDFITYPVATAPILQTSAWVNAASLLPGPPSWTVNTVLRYRKLVCGMVQWEGSVTSGNLGVNGGIIVSGVPSAFRPDYPVFLPAMCTSRGTPAGQKLRIRTDGIIDVFELDTTLSGDISFDACTYPVGNLP